MRTLSLMKPYTHKSSREFIQKTLITFFACTEPETSYGLFHTILIGIWIVVSAGFSISRDINKDYVANLARITRWKIWKMDSGLFLHRTHTHTHTVSFMNKNFIFTHTGAFYYRYYILCHINDEYQNLVREFLRHFFDETNNSNEFSKILGSVTLSNEYYDSIACTALFAYCCKLSNS